MVFHKPKAIRHLSILSLIKSLKNNVSNRTLIIIATVAVGILLQWFISYDGDGNGKSDLALWLSTFFDVHNSFYYTNYTLSFLRSAVFLMLCNAAINITSSYRVIGVMFFVIISMVFDLGSILSVDFYQAVKSMRYTDSVNFRGLYTLFEVFCVLYTFADWTLDRINHKAVDNTGANYGRLNSYFNKGRLASEKKTSQTHR